MGAVSEETEVAARTENRATNEVGRALLDLSGEIPAWRSRKRRLTRLSQYVLHFAGIDRCGLNLYQNLSVLGNRLGHRGHSQLKQRPRLIEAKRLHIDRPFIRLQHVATKFPDRYRPTV